MNKKVFDQNNFEEKKILAENLYIDFLLENFTFQLIKKSSSHNFNISRSDSKKKN